VNAPIRLRLTVWYVLVLAAVMIALGAFVVTRLESDLTNELDRNLRSAAVQTGRGYKAEGEKDFRDVASTVLPGPRAHGSGAQILQPSGTVVFSDGDPVTATAMIDAATRRRVLSGRMVTISRRLGSPSQHLRIVALPVEHAGVRQVLAVTESLTTVDRSTHRVLVLLLLGGSAALALAAAGGWWIARKALMPVERMTSRAHQIGIDDLSERIAVPRVHDEVGNLARTLNAMLDRLEEGVNARERLIADASHELRAPLAAMRSELEVSLRHDPLADQARAVLESARDEVVRMGRIVDHLLTLARFDEGGLELLVAPQDLRGTAEAAARAHRAAAEADGVSVTVEGNGAMVAGDAERLEQVLSNLVDNAVRHAPAGSDVLVRVWRDEAAAEAGVTVSDEGPGVPEGVRERIFERFARQDPARGRTGGAGLGLAISREIVLAHRGRIWVEPREPRGSAFVVALPLSGAPTPRRPQPGPPMTSPRS
jgi:heavy metal sensor kinase